jgi:hypothetical protein
MLTIENSKRQRGIDRRVLFNDNFEYGNVLQKRASR